jgi:hypothetical protein
MYKEVLYVAAMDSDEEDLNAERANTVKKWNLKT